MNYRNNKSQNMKTYGPSLSDSDDLEVMMKNFTKSYDDSDKLDIVIKGNFENFINIIVHYGVAPYTIFYREIFLHFCLSSRCKRLSRSYTGRY